MASAFRSFRVSDHLGWRQEADRLTAAAETILADSDTYGVHLDNMETGRVRVERELSRLSHVIRDDGEYASQRKTPESHSEPADTREKVEQPEPAKPAWMPAYEALRQDWNSLIEDARQAGIPSFYAKGYMDMIPRIQALAENPDIPAKTRAPLIRVLEKHKRFVSRPASISWTIQGKRNGTWMRAPLSSTLRRIRESK